MCKFWRTATLAADPELLYPAGSRLCYQSGSAEAFLARLLSLVLLVQPSQRQSDGVFLRPHIGLAALQGVSLRKQRDVCRSHCYFKEKTDSYP